MFTDTSFKKYAIDENNQSVGKVEVNLNIIQSEDFIRPFVRSSDSKEITKFGNRDYNLLDQYIISSLNNYYNRLPRPL